MDSLFFSRVVLSFVLAGSWIAFVTVLAERLGSRLGGLFTNLPSNILFSLIYIGLSNGIPFVTGMVPGIPLGMLIDTVFLVVMMATLRFGILRSLLASLGSWAILAWLANALPPAPLWLAVAIYLAGASGLYLVAEKRMNIPAVPASGKGYTLWQLSSRAAVAGAIVAGVVVVSQFAPPYLTGIISTFPAVLLSTMVILIINQGIPFARATGKILILSSSNIIVYGIVVYFTFPALGIALGTAVSFAASLIWVLALRPVSDLLSKK
jgi:hypothetical protein